jgi:hypothetical protein
MSVDLRACKRGDKLRLHNGKLAEYVCQLADGNYPHSVKMANGIAAFFTDDGRFDKTYTTDSDIIEIIPMTTDSTIPQRGTKDFTKYAISVMMAYDRDGSVEFKPRSCLTWREGDAPLWDWSEYDYRIKPKPTVIPWTKETCPVGEVIKIKDTGNRYLILAADNNVLMLESVYFTHSHTLEHCTMDDGSPCGTVQQ